MSTLVCPHFDPGGAAGKRIQNHPVVGVGQLPEATDNLPGLEMLHGSSQDFSVRIVERHIEMSLRRIDGMQTLEHIAGENQRAIFSLEPDFFNADHRRIDPLKLDMRDVGRCAKRCGAAG